LLQSIHLTKSYNSRPVVDDVSLTLEPGRIMALVGASGSGKSTLLSLLAAQTDADAGTVWLDGERVRGPGEVLVAGHPHLKLVHQQYQLQPNVSVAANIAYALRFYEKTYRDFRVAELLSLCRLEVVQHQTPKQISGGEAQRTAIARAIAEKPEPGRTTALLLDEPFSHLDLPNRAVMADLLLDLVRQDRVACLFVTHDATDALALADTLGILRTGQLIQTGTPAEVYLKPTTAYAAALTGPVNLVKARFLPVLGLSAGVHPDALAFWRPQQLRLTAPDSSAIRGRVRAVGFRGHYSDVEVFISRYVTLRLLVLPDEAPLLGDTVGVMLPDAAIRWVA
jgi:ABC-type Fe3+/spermidine/putrescine transport system ATPase subunit